MNLSLLLFPRFSTRTRLITNSLQLTPSPNVISRDLNYLAIVLTLQ